MQDDEMRTTPIGLMRYAFEYIDAARTVDEVKGEQTLLSRASYTPAYFLALHGIELTLKSFLLFHDVPLKKLRGDFGHDLKKCLRKSKELGLSNLMNFTVNDESAMELLLGMNENQGLRYIQTGFKTVPLWSIVEPLAVRLHQAVAREIRVPTFFDSFQEC